MSEYNDDLKAKLQVQQSDELGNWRTKTTSEYREEIDSGGFKELNTWDEKSEKDIIIYYYKKHKSSSPDLTFEEASKKLAITINRLFGQKLTDSDVLSKIQKYITDDVVNEPVNRPVSKKQKTISIKINLKERKYSYFKNKIPLSNENLDLCSVVDCSKICFSSSDEKGLFLSCETDTNNCFLDNMLNENDQKKLEMFKSILGDELKAKKLVIISKVCEEKVPPVKENIPQKSKKSIKK